MIVRYTLTAEAEIRAIQAYISAHSPRGAALVLARLERTIEWLREFPEMGRVVDGVGTRVLMAGRFPYLVFYEADGEWLTIRNVRHAARRRPPRRERRS